MRRLAVLTVLLLVVTACEATIPPASPGSSPATTTPSPTDPPATIEASPAPTPTPAGATDDVAAEPDPATFLQVCRAFEGAGGEPPIPCEDAVTTALAAEAETAPTRVDVRFACEGAPSCTAPDPARVFVTVVADGTATEVEVTRASDGTVAATTTRPGTLATPPAFTPPAPALAALPGGPASLATRPPYPLCGEEETPMGGPYDEAARTCFLTGVLAGSPVEFVSRGDGTEGGPYVHLYRYSGSGGLELVTGEGGVWLRRVTGIAEAGGGLVFSIGGMSTAREPVP